MKAGRKDLVAHPSVVAVAVAAQGPFGPVAGSASTLIDQPVQDLDHRAPDRHPPGSSAVPAIRRVVVGRPSIVQESSVRSWPGPAPVRVDAAGGQRYHPDLSDV